MRYQISKSFTFDADHWVPGLPEGHKCGRQHDHSYVVQVFLSAQKLSGPGFVVDFGELSPLRDHLRQNLDRRLLNDVMTAAPTSENIALKLFDWCHEHLALPDGATVDAIRVSETPSTWAEYRPEPETTTPAVFG